MRGSIIICVLATMLCGCSPDDDLSGGATSIVRYPYIDENRWIYATMNRHYLWREDLPDSSSCNYNLYPIEFYKSLLSNKDRFSYYEVNRNFTRAQETTNRYGFAYQRYIDDNGNIYYEVLYITNPELRRYGLQRGDFLVHEGGDEYAPKFRKVVFQGGKVNYDSLVFDVCSTTRSTSNSTVLLDTIYNIDNRKIGYLCYLRYDSKSDLIKPLRHFYDSCIDDLILDLRYNPGGYVSTCSFLSTIVAPETAYGGIFQIKKYNDIIAQENFEKTGDYFTYEYLGQPYIPDSGGNFLGTPVYGLNLSRLYVITSRHTASASEATIKCLQPYMSVYIIGEQTTGKGTGMYGLSTSECRITLYPITMRYYNKNNETVPDEGLVPDKYCPDGYNTRKRDIGDINENLLSSTLTFMGLNIDKAEEFDDDIPCMTPLGVPSFVDEYKPKNEN